MGQSFKKKFMCTYSTTSWSSVHCREFVPASGNSNEVRTRRECSSSWRLM